MSVYYSKLTKQFYKVVEDDFDYLEEDGRFSKYNSTFLTFVRGYKCPDESDLRSWEDVFNFFGVEDDNLKTLKTKAKEKGYVLSVVYGLLHSGLSYSVYDFNDQFDGGVAGVIFCKLEDNDEQEVQKALSDEVDYYSNYYNSTRYEILIYSNEGEFVDSITGYSQDVDNIEEIKKFIKEETNKDVSDLVKSFM